MPPPPNVLYTVFAFIGFVLCAIPFYWHLRGKSNHPRAWNVLLTLDEIAWNTGTCLFMIWAGLGCLMQGINSIVWNKNIINRVPAYCVICKIVHAFVELMSLTLLYPTATRFQVALNAALPACSLCINRRLHKIATTKAVVFTNAQRRRALICDLLICVGIPIFQIFARECTWVSFVCQSFTGMESRVYCFVESIQHI